MKSIKGMQKELDKIIKKANKIEKERVQLLDRAQFLRQRIAVKKGEEKVKND